MIDETNVLVEAFDSADENIVENETESELEDDDGWYKSESVFCNWCNYVEFLMYYEIDVTMKPNLYVYHCLHVLCHFHLSFI